MVFHPQTCRNNKIIFIVLVYTFIFKTLFNLIANFGKKCHLFDR